MLTLFGLSAIPWYHLETEDVVSSVYGVVGWLLSLCDNPLTQSLHLKFLFHLSFVRFGGLAGFLNSLKSEALSG